MLSIMLTINVQGQTLAEKIASNACEYLDSINDFKVLQDSIRPSIIAAMTKVMMESDDNERMGTVEGIQETIKKSLEILPVSCYNVRRLIIEDKKSRFYKLSDDPLANLYYNKGNGLMEKGEYKDAIREFKSAVKSDKNFVYAIDHLAISYRRLEDYKSAVKHYKKSLEIFPEGYVALLNIAVSYTFLNDNVNAMKTYGFLKFLYPNDPEGYFGLAKMQFLKGDYENAADNLLTAHRMYVNTNSEYVEDSEKLMSLLSAKLKELNKTEILNQKAKAYNINIKE